jgi:hypothetical protein
MARLCHNGLAWLRPMQKARLGLALSAFALAGGPAFAGQQTGQVTQVVVRASDGLVYFYMSGTPSGRAPCATNTYWIIKDENSAAGKRQLAVLLMARETGQQVIVGGGNTCTRWSDGEDVEFIRY